MKKRSKHARVIARIELLRAEYTRSRKELTYGRNTPQEKAKYQFPPGSAYNDVLKRTIVPVPKELDLTKHRDDTLQVAEACRQAVFFDRRPIVLDFRQTTSISPAAALYLCAEIYRCRQNNTSKLVTGTYPQDRKVLRQMQDCGFFDILKVKNVLPESSKTFPLEYIKVLTGVGADAQFADRLHEKLMGTDQMNEGAYKAFYRGVSEAMTNVAQHADPEHADASKVKRLRQRWWMLGHTNKLRKELKIMIVDQGIGISRSLPLKYPMEFINSLLSNLGLTKPTDGEMIEAAMEVGRTKTYRPHQGKGLNDLKKFVDTAGDGARLRILSNRGEYLYTVAKQSETKAHTQSIKGTLIEWTVPLEAITSLVTKDLE